MATPAKPLLHLVFGGEVKDPAGTDFVDASKLDVVGLFPNYATALKAWKGASMAQIDNASFKYVIVHLHRLMDPDNPEPEARAAKKPTVQRAANKNTKNQTKTAKQRR